MKTFSKTKIDVIKRYDPAFADATNDDEIVICGKCGREVLFSQTERTFDCHGIPFRRVCPDCLKLVNELGYDGIAYDEQDGPIDCEY